MRVVHVFNSGCVSGPETLVIPALKNLDPLFEVWSLEELRLDKKQRDLLVMCEQMGLPVRKFPVTKRFDLLAIINLARRLKEFPCSVIIHSHDAKASLYIWVAKLLSGNTRLPLVATHHGAMVRADRLSRLYEMIFVFVAKRFYRCLLCVSENEYRILRNRGVPRTVLRLHRNGISRPELAWTQRRVQESDETLRFVIVARLSREKNHLRALRVLSCYSKLFSKNWTLDLIGEGSEQEKITLLTNDLGLANHVRFRGYVADAWKEFDLYHCLLSFSMGEGLPITLLEAGWRRTPVFASDVGGVPELCGEGGGVLFSLRQSNEDIARRLYDYINSIQERKNATEVLFQRVSRMFSEQHWREQLLYHYHAALGAVS